MDSDLPNPFNGWMEDRKRRKELKENRKQNPGLNKKSILKKTKLKSVSSKQRKRNQEYKQARENHYSKDSNRQCALCGITDHLSIHHKGKRGSNTTNEESFITLCLTGVYTEDAFPELNHSHSGGCHGFIEANKAWARANGYLD